MSLAGRAAECSRIDVLLGEAATGQAGALLLHGEPGIGKSVLLEHAMSNATASGMRVVRYRAVEAESVLPFSGLLELVRPLLPALEGLPEAQASVLEGALALAPPVPADRFAVCAATLSLVAAAAEQDPLLVVVDDIQWLDAASLEALLFVSRRLHADAVCLILAVRDPIPRVIERADLPRLEVSGLELEAARSLLAQVARTMVSDDVSRRVVEQTGGNPLALIELARLLSASELAGRSALREPLEAGPTIERAFAERLTELTADARSTLVVAAASMTGLVAPILAALADLALEVGALERAEARGFVAIGHGRLTFRHPLLRSVAYHTAAPGERRAAHRALAAHEDRDQAAWHLAEAAVAPDEDVAALLEAAATSARARSGFVVAGDAYERAGELTPDAPKRAQRWIEAARCFEVGGFPERADDVLDRALQQPESDDSLQVDVMHARAHAAMRRGLFAVAADLLLQAAASVEPVDRERASALFTEAALALIPTERGPEALGAAEKAVSLTTPGSQSRFVAETWLDGVQVLRGVRGKFGGLGVAELAESVEFSVESAELIAHGCHYLFWTERYDRARVLIDRTLDAARSASAIGAMPHLLAAKAQLEFRTGNWLVAHAAAAEAVRLSDDTGAGATNPFPLAYLAWIEAGLGLEQESREHGNRSIRVAESQQSLAALDYAHAALGLLELGLGMHERAIAELEQVVELELRYGLRDPSVSPWRPDLIEAYVRVGRLDDADELLLAFETEARRTRRSWPRAAAHRCRGTLTADFKTEFGKAIRLHRETPTPFELARTQLSYGERLRRNRQRLDARAQLRSALATFEHLGAQPWALRARQELVASGERARRRDRTAPDQLTPQEIQVATLVAAGSSNKDTASRLFISPRTIDAHLGHIYRKLNIHSRADLALALLAVGVALPQ